MSFLHNCTRLLLLALACCACGADDQESPPKDRLELPLDLLVRDPDTRFEHPGVLTPEVGVEWGEYRGPGWTRWSTGKDWVLPDGSLYLETNQPVACLLLPAPEPEARELELYIWCPEPLGAEGAEVSVLLNGRELGKRKLGTQPATLRFETPRELWNKGSNRLELAASRANPDDPHSAWETLALARVAYGSERRVEVERSPGRLGLPAGGGVRYFIETTTGGPLTMQGHAAGTGELQLSVATMNTRTGNLSAAHAQQGFGAQGDFHAAFQLEPLTLEQRAAGELLVLELTWKSADKGALSLARLELQEEAALPRPPVIFISIDTLAARHMSVYGYGRETTPVLERFAEEAVVFEHCRANAPWTLPSYLSVMTGLYPASHYAAVQEASGVQLDNYDYWQVATSRWTLAEMLRARGYQTAASVDTLWLSPRYRIHQGFDVYDLEPAQHDFWRPEKGIRMILERYGPWLDELREPSAPFFTFIHALDAHGPYWPEDGFKDVFRSDLPEERRSTLAGSAPQTYAAIPTWMAWTLAPEQHVRDVSGWDIPRNLPLEEIIERYDETILKCDTYIGKLFDMLRERGLFEDSIIVISGDHGESFDHDFYSHGCMWEDILHVPLLIKLPEGKSGGLRVSESVQLVDLYPTLFELTGAGTARDYLHGRSLVPLLSGEPGSSGDARVTFAEGGHVEQYMLELDGMKLIEMFPGHNAGKASLLTHPLIPGGWVEKNFPELADAGMLTDELRLSLIAQEGFDTKFRELQDELAGPYYELYDLRNDPDEQHDLASERPEELERLKALLEAERARATRARADAKPDLPPPPKSAEDERRLNALGYVEDH